MWKWKEVVKEGSEGGSEGGWKSGGEGGGEGVGESVGEGCVEVSLLNLYWKWAWQIDSSYRSKWSFPSKKFGWFVNLFPPQFSNNLRRFIEWRGVIN